VEVYHNNRINIIRQAIDSNPAISQDKTEELLIANRLGNRDSINQVIESHLYLVIQEVWNHIYLPIKVDDMIGIGCLALCSATSKYTNNKTSFKSFSRSFIHWRLLHESRLDSFVIRLPSTVKYDRLKLISDQMNIDDIASRYYYFLADIDSSLSDMASEGVFLYRIPFSDRNIDIYVNPDFEESLELPLINRVLLGSLEKLPYIDSEVIRLYYGLNREHPLTLEEIGELFNLTRERIRQVRNRALNKLSMNLNRVHFFTSDDHIKNLSNVTSSYSERFIAYQNLALKKETFWNEFGVILREHEKRRRYYYIDFISMEKSVIDFLWAQGEPATIDDIMFYIDTEYENANRSFVYQTIEKSKQVIRVKKNSFALKEWGYIPQV